MTDTRRGKPTVGQFRHPIPREAVLLAGHVMPERRERPTVCGYRIIGEVACNDLPQPVSLIWDRLVHALPQLRLDFLELRPHAVAPGLPLELEGSPSRFAADEGETQESEGLRSADTAFLVVGCRMAAELNQAGLVRMERQRECLEPLTHRIEEATCVVLMLEAGYQIIGAAVASVRPTDRIRSASRCCRGAVRSPNLGRFHCQLRLRPRLRGCPP